MILEDFATLDEHGVEYTILRNWEPVLEGEYDDDIDILIPRRQRKLAESVLEERGYQPKRGGTTRHSFYKKYDEFEESIISLDIAWDGTGYNGLPLVDAERMVEGRKLKEGIWIPCDEDLFVHLLFHTILNKNGFEYRSQYRTRLLELKDTVDAERVRDHSYSLFGRRGRVVADLALDGQLEKTEEHKWRLVFENLRRRPKLMPTLVNNLLIFHQVVNPLISLNKRYNPFSQQPTVVLLGPDGSGKTTTATNIQTFFEEQGLETTYSRLGVYNENSFVMQTLKRIRNTIIGYDSEQTSKARNSGKMELGAKNGSFKSLIHALDILVRIGKAYMSGSEVIIADRYLHDIHNFDKPGIVKHAIELLERGPVYIYVLDADSEIIASRSEYTLESIQTMQKRLEAVNGERIDVSESPNETQRALLKHLLTETDFLSRLF